MAWITTNNLKKFADLFSERVTNLFAKKTDIPKAMEGATADKAGTAGLVPPSTAGSQGKYLRADGTWQTPPNTTYGNMAGATASAAGTAGLVPAPAKGAQGKFLRGDGTWAEMTEATDAEIDSIIAGTFS